MASKIQFSDPFLYNDGAWHACELGSFFPRKKKEEDSKYAQRLSCELVELQSQEDNEKLLKQPDKAESVFELVLPKQEYLLSSHERRKVALPLLPTIITYTYHRTD